MTLLQEIQDAVVDSSVSLADALRRSKILAARLQHDPFMEWVEHELNGYPPDQVLPDYRVFPAHARGNFLIGAYRQTNAALSLSLLPAETARQVTRIMSRDSVGYLEDLVRRATGREFHMPMSSDFLDFYNSRMEFGRCTHAWQAVPVSAIVGLLDTVRNRLLSFVMELEAISPTAGESSSWGTTQQAQEKVIQIFSTTIGAGATNVSIASKKVSQVSVETVRPFDFSSLASFLQSNGLTEADVRDLEAAIKAEPAVDEPGKWGPRVSAWIGAALGKAVSGTWDIGIEVAGTLIATAIARYYEV